MIRCLASRFVGGGGVEEEVEEVEEVEEAEEVEEKLTAAEARAEAASEGLTLRPSESTGGYFGVSWHGSLSRLERPFQARISRLGEAVNLGYFATAEEAALTYARAKSHKVTVSQLPRARANANTTKRAAPPPKPPRTKQARQATATRPSQAVPPPAHGVAAAAEPTPAALPAETLLQKVGRIKAVLQMDPRLPLVDAIKAANELVGIGLTQGATPAPLLSQVDTLLATIGI